MWVMNHVRPLTEGDPHTDVIRGTPEVADGRSVDLHSFLRTPGFSTTRTRTDRRAVSDDIRPQGIFHTRTPGVVFLDRSIF